VAILDPHGQCLIIRIVYDGPALSGKTTTLRSLAASLGRDLYSGDEAEGRTLFFDWLDYTAGRFEGYPIRCQAISVPGQRALRSRRERLLEGADAVVFVADSRSSQLDAGHRTLQSLTRLLGSASPPTPGVVVQANKRDDPEAAPMAEVRERLGGLDGVAIRETVAVGGNGVREAFVMAVRMAIDRARALARGPGLTRGRPESDSGAELLAALRDDERAAAAAASIGEARPGSDASRELAAVVTGETGTLADVGPVPDRREAPDIDAGRLDRLARQQPRIPDATLPGGLLWPPVRGRIALHEATAPGELALAMDACRGWGAETADWQMLSYAADVFADLDSARKALLDWVHWHLDVGRLSSRRCVLACPAVEDSYRLWQIVRRERTLAEELESVLEAGPPQRLAQSLLDLALAFVDSLAIFEPRSLPCRLDTLALEDSRVVFCGPAPGLGSASASDASTAEPAEERLRGAFAPAIARSVEQGKLDVPRLLDPVRRLAASRGQPRAGEILRALLIGG